MHYVSMGYSSENLEIAVDNVNLFSGTLVPQPVKGETLHCTPRSIAKTTEMY